MSSFVCWCLTAILLSASVGHCQWLTNGRRSKLIEPSFHRSRVVESRQTVFPNPVSGRNGRFLSLFTYVQFNNQQCVTTDLNIGTCTSISECTRRGGTASGTCAGGYGTCCLFLVSCGGTITENGTYFVNNNYPQAHTGDLVRLDFDTLLLTGPEASNHICNSDQFIVSGNQRIPTICGNSSGNHMYVDTGAGITNPVILSILTNNNAPDKMWKIRVAQVPCNVDYRAQEGCLQYFTGVAGRILSFNYDPVNGAQLSNQDYGICVRAERNFCGIQYNQCTDVVTANNISQSFTLSGNSNNRVQAMVGSTGPNSCQFDYLIIPMASNVGRPATGLASSVDRVCGGILSADVTFNPTTVRSIVRPFQVWFHTDGLEAPTDIDNKGFCIDYVQQPCNSR